MQQGLLSSDARQLSDVTNVDVRKGLDSLLLPIVVFLSEVFTLMSKFSVGMKNGADLNVKDQNSGGGATNLGGGEI